MAYASWSVVFGEQPSAAKWNILGTNDSSFNDGTGIANMSMSTTSVSNPYKFRAYRTTSAQTVATGFVKVQLNAETYDTNNNFDSTTNYRYTAPVSGFYLVGGAVSMSTSTNDDYQANIYKNGSVVTYGNLLHAATGTTTLRPVVVDIIQLTAGDYIELYSYTSNVGGADIGAASTTTYFYACLQSRT